MDASGQSDYADYEAVLAAARVAVLLDEAKSDSDFEASSSSSSSSSSQQRHAKRKRISEEPTLPREDSLFLYADKEWFILKVNVTVMASRRREWRRFLKRSLENDAVAHKFHEDNVQSHRELELPKIVPGTRDAVRYIIDRFHDATVEAPPPPVDYTASYYAELMHLSRHWGLPPDFLEHHLVRMLSRKDLIQLAEAHDVEFEYETWQKIAVGMSYGEMIEGKYSPETVFHLLPGHTSPMYDAASAGTVMMMALLRTGHARTLHRNLFAFREINSKYLLGVLLPFFDTDPLLQKLWGGRFLDAYASKDTDRRVDCIETTPDNVMTYVVDGFVLRVQRSRNAFYISLTTEFAHIIRCSSSVYTDEVLYAQVGKQYMCYPMKDFVNGKMIRFDTESRDSLDVDVGLLLASKLSVVRAMVKPGSREVAPTVVEVKKPELPVKPVEEPKKKPLMCRMPGRPVEEEPKKGPVKAKPAAETAANKPGPLKPAIKPAVAKPAVKPAAVKPVVVAKSSIAPASASASAKAPPAEVFECPPMLNDGREEVSDGEAG